jgi:hypothetical protein
MVACSSCGSGRSGAPPGPACAPLQVTCSGRAALRERRLAGRSPRSRASKASTSRDASLGKCLSRALLASLQPGSASACGRAGMAAGGMGRRRVAGCV